MISIVLLVGCSAAPEGGSIIDPGGITGRIAWSPEERTQEIAVKTLRKTDAASFHVIRLAGSEKPHIHERSDLLVFMLSGRVRMHLGDAVIEAMPGDVIDIPRGAPHWAQNIASGASEAYAIYTPAFDGTDRRPVP